MNEQEQYKAQLDNLKVRLFDASETLAEQSKMIEAIVSKLKFKGNSFDELLQAIPEGVEESTQVKEES